MTVSRARWLAITAVAAIFVFQAGVAASQIRGQALDGDAASGRRLAEAWCAECHAVGSTPSIGTGPAFAAIAERPSTTALSLGVFLRSSHEPMPNFIIKPSDADDIIAYILSLKTK